MYTRENTRTYGDAIYCNIFRCTRHSSGPAIEKRLLGVLFFPRCADVCFHRTKHRGGVYSAKLPKKRRKLDCLYYSPLAFDKYGCKCKTGSGSARPETRFIHIHPARARIGVTYLAKFLPSRQSHSINSERTYLACVLSTYGTRVHTHTHITRMRARTYVFYPCVERGTEFTARLSSLEYLVKYFTHREIFTHYIHPSFNEGVYSFNHYYRGGAVCRDGRISLYAATH